METQERADSKGNILFTVTEEDLQQEVIDRLNRELTADELMSLAELLQDCLQINLVFVYDTVFEKFRAVYN